MIFFSPYPGQGSVYFKSITSKQSPLSISSRDIIARIGSEWKIHWELYIFQLFRLVSYRSLNECNHERWKGGAIITNMRSLMGFPDGYNYNGPKGSQGTSVVKLTPSRNASKCHIFSFFDLTPLPNIYFYSIWFGRPPQKRTRILATSNSDSL